MFSVPNELAGGNKIAMKKAKAKGLVSGVSDTIIVLNHIIIFCEFKTQKGNQSEAQIKFENRVNKYHQYWLIRDFETFKLKINEIKSGLKNL
jgi:hypothetical protein